VEERVSRIYDTNLGSQGSAKEIKAAVKGMNKSVGKADANAASGMDLIRDLKGSHK
jgi:hypothetical protein